MQLTFWDGFFQTLNFEKRDIKEIEGALGIKHKILSLGIDETQKRIVIVQDEQDPRILAMVQADLQSKIKDYSVLMVRPVSINLSVAFNSLAVLMGGYRFDKKDLEEWTAKGDPELAVERNQTKLENVMNLMGPQIEIIQKTKPNLVSVFQEVVNQLSTLKFLSNVKGPEDFFFDFGEILNFNPVVHDNNLGICPIPLYDFSVDEAESFLKKNNKDINEIILKKHAIHQFFYPPADSLALGLIEKNSYTPQQLITQIQDVPKYGHPFGKNELTEIKNITDVVEALKEKGLVVEGEFSMGITEDGKEKRMLVKFSPRESIFKRLSNIFSVKLDINLKDLFK